MAIECSYRMSLMIKQPGNKRVQGKDDGKDNGKDEK